MPFATACSTICARCGAGHTVTGLLSSRAFAFSLACPLLLGTLHACVRAAVGGTHLVTCFCTPWAPGPKPGLDIMQPGMHRQLAVCRVQQRWPRLPRLWGSTGSSTSTACSALARAGCLPRGALLNGGSQADCLQVSAAAASTYCSGLAISGTACSPARLRHSGT